MFQQPFRTNILQISDDPEHPANRPFAIATDDCTEIEYRPPAWTSGTVIAYRTAQVMDAYFSVMLYEYYPQRRIWSNLYNAGTNNWEGWKSITLS